MEENRNDTARTTTTSFNRLKPTDFEQLHERGSRGPLNRSTVQLRGQESALRPATNNRQNERSTVSGRPHRRPSAWGREDVIGPLQSTTELLGLDCDLDRSKSTSDVEWRFGRDRSRRAYSALHRQQRLHSQGPSFQARYPENHFENGVLPAPCTPGQPDRDERLLGTSDSSSRQGGV